MKQDKSIGGMKMLPSDPIMLLSYINTKLRDEYASLDDLCDSLDADKQEILNRLSEIGYVYDEKSNKFLSD